MKCTVLFLLITFVWFSNFSVAATVEYDSSFDDDGFNSIDVSANIDVPFDVVQGPDGKYYMGGEASSSLPTDGYFVVTRFNQDGSIDSSFGTDGVASVNFNLTSNALRDSGRHMHIQTDGKIYVSGEVDTPLGYIFGVARFLEDGSLDTSFSTDGKTSFSFTGDDNERSSAVSLITDDAGYVYVAGGYSSNQSKPMVAKLFSNGLFDNSFNLTGKKILEIDGLNGIVQDIHLLSAGDILITGTVFQNDDNRDYFVARLNPDGSFDTDFNVTGYRVIPFDLFPDAADVALSSHLTEDDGVIMVGASVNGIDNEDYDMAVMKVNLDGSMSTTFGSSGKVVVTLNSGAGAPDLSYGVDIQADGKIILCGFSGPSFSNTLPTYVRLLEDGQRDLDFGDFGVVILPSFPNAPSDYISQIINCKIDNQNRLMSAATVNHDSGSEFGITRIDLGLDLIFENGFEVIE